MFRESYVYMDENGQVLDSQSILDDVESLAGAEPVRRYDVFGNRHPTRTGATWSLWSEQTREIFGRDLDIGITEYLPAGPVQINESDTSPYEDIDFLIHYADLVGTYAEQGLDVVSTWMFANETDQAKCYVDKQGNRGSTTRCTSNWPSTSRVPILQVERPAAYSALRVKVYVAEDGGAYFVVLLNKDVERRAHDSVAIGPGDFDLRSGCLRAATPACPRAGTRS